jgi:hypothetical protein
MNYKEKTATYINNIIKNSTVFLMKVRLDEVEEDCTSFYKSSKLHEFRFVELVGWGFLFILFK